MEQVRNALAAMDEIAAPWQPHRLTSINDYDVKLAKFEGEFVWHTHPDTEEFFLVLAGSISIRMRDRDVELGPHDVFHWQWVRCSQRSARSHGNSNRPTVSGLSRSSR